MWSLVIAALRHRDVVAHPLQTPLATVAHSTVAGSAQGARSHSPTGDRSCGVRRRALLAWPLGMGYCCAQVCPDMRAPGALAPAPACSSLLQLAPACSSLLEPLASHLSRRLKTGQRVAAIVAHAAAERLTFRPGLGEARAFHPLAIALIAVRRERRKRIQGRAERFSDHFQLLERLDRSKDMGGVRSSASVRRRPRVLSPPRTP
jgi:hypothetical protein